MLKNCIVVDKWQRAIAREEINDKNGINAPLPLQQILFKDLFTVIPFNGWLSKIPYNKYKFVFVRVY